MKKPEITPGPWRYEKGRICYGETVQTERGTSMNVIAQPHGGVLRTYKGNCQAIAAVPDLLEALEAAYKAMTETAWKMESNQDARNLLKKADQVQAALTKAGYTFD